MNLDLGYLMRLVYFIMLLEGLFELLLIGRLLLLLFLFPVRLISLRFENLLLVGNWKLLLEAVCFAILSPDSLLSEVLFTLALLSLRLLLTCTKSVSIFTGLALK